MNNWPSDIVLNPSNAMLDKPESYNPIFTTDDSTKMLVKHDFIRYLSSHIFGTSSGTDLFNNETQMLNALNTIGNNVFQNDISGVLWQYSATNPNPQITETYLLDISNNYYYTTDYMDGRQNICRELFQQLIHTNATRFSQLNSPTNNNLFSLPILAGDTISFLYTIHPAEGQELLTGVDTIPSRNYEIRIVIDDGTNSNTSPVD